ncbi:major facilitator superfamily domain-containing protein [Leucosporidium creatinivorum]|uniref:Major facilitator superfamily domain-containing protein n=1 Tax=Leucosporidium creatinivorum TaxID=106004 RepID=A0A1Y2D6S9_9BASI|nr:major facilitator superfamily domain-containing protein [Leucosporidium creatinivorum]
MAQVEKDPSTASAPPPPEPKVEADGYATNATDALALFNLVSAEQPAHPMHWPAWKRWSIVTIYCFLQVFVSMLSTEYVSVEFLIQERWGGSTQVVTLGQSMFIVGTVVGPAFLGPASDMLGRKWIYVAAMTFYAIVNFGIAYPTGLPMLVIFMFLAGMTGSVALVNVAGTIADLFGDEAGSAQAMALFAASANIGPSLGSPVGEWIAENASMGFKWVGLINVIVAFAFSASLCFIPETLPKIVIPRSKNISGEADNEVAHVLASTKVSLRAELYFSATMAMKIMFGEPIVAALGITNGLAFGIVFLYLDGVFDVFAVNNGLSYISADLSYLNFAAGVIIMFIFFVPLQTYLVKRDRRKTEGQVRPEARFLLSLVTVWGMPVGLLWFAWTSYGNVSYWSPIIAGTVVAIADTLAWLSMLCYITDSYTNVAGSAIAAFLIPSFTIAAACAHLGVLLFERESTQWAFTILGLCSLSVVGIVNILYFFGPQLRRRSKYARTF